MMDDPVVHPSNTSSGERRRSSRFRSTSQALSETPERSTRSTPITSVQDTPQDDKQSVEDESPVPQRSLRQRRSAVPNGPVLDPVEEGMKPLTDEERQNWAGWVELESDPVSTSCLQHPYKMKHPREMLQSRTDFQYQALFSYILRQYGVKNIKIQEIFGLDDESLLYLPYASPSCHLNCC